jgi:hypothetical protein
MFGLMADMSGSGVGYVRSIRIMCYKKVDQEPK